MCKRRIPVVHQGKFEGILYLENNLTTDAFTAERVRVLEVLSSQAAISLENARLYEQMKQEVAQRQRAEETLRTIVEGTAAVTGRDFFAAFSELNAVPEGKKTGSRFLAADACGHEGIARLEGGRHMTHQRMKKITPGQV